MELENISSEERLRLRNRIIERLKNEANQEGLADLIIAYYVDTREIATLAETMAEGMRFDGLANEVYACFQHVARGLAEESPDTLTEFEKAKNSHLKRLRLDGHKIVINRALQDAKPVLDLIDFLSSNSEIIKLLPDGNENLVRVRQMRKQLRISYHKAKRSEGKGESQTLEHYHVAVEHAIQLLMELEHFVGTNEVLFALKREEEKRLQGIESVAVSREANKISKISIVVATIAAAAALAALGWNISKDSKEVPTTSGSAPTASGSEE